jgi:hypothetical protein
MDAASNHPNRCLCGLDPFALERSDAHFTSFILTRRKRCKIRPLCSGACWATAADCGTLAAPVEAPVTLVEEPVAAEVSAEQP